jgi:hypothetical protein
MDMGFSVLDWKKNEVVFVAAVLTITFGISWFQLKTGEMKTRDAQRKADVELVARALSAYHDDYDIYPNGTEDGKIVSCGNRGSEECVWGEGTIVDGDNVTYLKKMPQDPFDRNGRRYVYEVRQDKKDFRIYAALEYKGDASYKSDLTRQCGINVQCSWYAGH